MAAAFFEVKHEIDILDNDKGYAPLFQKTKQLLNNVALVTFNAALVACH